MQKRMSHDTGFVADNLAIRIGLHHGDALHEDGDVYGDAVNTAARMASLAKREQIVTTATHGRRRSTPARYARARLGHGARLAASCCRSRSST